MEYGRQRTFVLNLRNSSWGFVWLLISLAGCSNESMGPVVTYHGNYPERRPDSFPNGNPEATKGVTLTVESNRILREASEDSSRRIIPTGSTASKRTRLVDHTDGLNETVWFGSVPDHLAVPWTKPQDLVFDRTFPSDGNTFADGYFCFANGSVQWLPVREGMNRDAFRALFTIAGNDRNALNRLYPNGKPKTSSQNLRGESLGMANNKELATAMMNYTVATRRLPPAEWYGPDGKPWVSWRVLLLPFIAGHEELSKHYDFSVPWDHPNNAYVLENMPSVFRDPIAPHPDKTKTKILLMTGEGTAFPLE
jgi:hypothetical protein